jgi:YidC/Oxa1 family membrane protein insertase
MDRRSLLAIVLSTLVILVFQFYFMPRPKPKATALTGSIDSVAALAPPHSAPGVPFDSAAAAPDTTLPGAGLPGQFPAGPTLRQAPGATASTFGLSIDGVEARFSTMGGGIESWRLKAFRGPDGNPVEMVRSGPEPSVVLHVDGRDIDLSRGLYTSQVEELAGGAQRVTFRGGEPGGLEVVKRFLLTPQSPLYELDVEVVGLPPTTGDAWVEIGWLGGLPQAEKDAKTDQTTYGAIVSVGQDVQRTSAGSFKKEKEKTVNGAIHWVASRNKYFMAGIVPAEGAVTTARTFGDAESHRAGAAVRLPILDPENARHSVRLYLGPIDYWKLKDVGFGLDRAVDLGWKILMPISQLLLWLLNTGYKLVPNYGVVIILLSTLTRLVFYPLTKTSMRSMKAMQEIQPQMEKLRKKFKDDPQRLNQEVFALYREHKINPVSGCLPLLLQMPVFFALYTVLANSVELRQAPFVAWIDDLSAPDVLVRIGGFGIHVLPILMAATMFWQQKLTPTDPRQAMLLYLMPVMMLFFLYSVPSGLALYWTVINILSVAQQYQMNRESKVAAAKAG